MSSPLHPIDIIVRKRDGHTLSEAEIAAFIRAIVDRTPERPLVTDPQIASLLMAIFQRGLDGGELGALTAAMRTSGTVFDRRMLGPGVRTVDKHSTGGVGDKTSLLLAPILAAAGLAEPTPDGVPGICVPMISGRALGHTGGTLDKLESIPGFDTQLSLARFAEMLRACGAGLIGQTPDLVPADRILYALRDHTGTVESVPLIAASIMSKKLAEDLDALVLDVKTGSGAFLRENSDARRLAQTMVETGERAGTRTVALLTRMDEPLGRFAGNWVEVWECVDILKGRAHPLSRDLVEVTLALGGWMLHLAGQTESPESGRERTRELLDSGAAYAAWLGIARAQGGDLRVFADPAALHRPAATRTLIARGSGFLAPLDCTAVGWAVQRLGAGRTQPGEPVSPSAGIEVHVKVGDGIAAGQPLVTLFADDAERLAEPYAMLEAAYAIDSRPAPRPPLLQEVLRPASSRSLPPGSREQSGGR